MKFNFDEWNKIMNLSIIGAIVTIIMASILIGSCQDIHIGKSRKEINSELTQSMFEVDSLIMTIKLDLDSLQQHNK